MFQFPSNGKVYSETATDTLVNVSVKSFQFPSNGKVYSEFFPLTQLPALSSLPIVSIPFKRESVFRGGNPDFSRYAQRVCVVSIPFKRESVFREVQLCLLATRRQQVSIPFKRESVFRAVSTDVEIGDEEFQFPSNGKVYSERPQFAPSQAVVPKRQNQTRAARGFFYFKIYPKNPANPRVH